MKVYSSDGKYIIETDDMHIFDHGTYGNIYKYDDNTCFKVFKHIGFHKEEPIIVLKELELKNFNRIIDLLYDRNLQYAGYLTDFYQRDDFDILSDKEYLVDSVNNIYDGIMELTKKSIMVNDLHKGNVITTKDGIFVIDVDDYKHINSDNTYINTYRFKQMLKSILYDALINYSLTNPQESYALIKRLVDEDHTNINHFNNVMKRYTKPIDYFSKVLK